MEDDPIGPSSHSVELGRLEDLPRPCLALAVQLDSGVRDDQTATAIPQRFETLGDLSGPVAVAIENDGKLPPRLGQTASRQLRALEAQGLAARQSDNDRCSLLAESDRQALGLRSPAALSFDADQSLEVVARCLHTVLLPELDELTVVPGTDQSCHSAAFQTNTDVSYIDTITGLT